MAHAPRPSYSDPYIPHDLRNLPGNWRSHIAGYYGAVQAIDDCVGAVVAALQRTNQLDNTIIVFFSDHGCTFRTRLGEYKRSPHDSSLRVPMVIAGPGFNQSRMIDEVVLLLDLTPTLLDGAGITPPTSMRGRPLKPLVDSFRIVVTFRTITGRISAPPYAAAGVNPSAAKYVRTVTFRPISARRNVTLPLLQPRTRTSARRPNRATREYTRSIRTSDNSPTPSSQPSGADFSRRIQTYVLTLPS